MLKTVVQATTPPHFGELQHNEAEHTAPAQHLHLPLETPPDYNAVWGCTSSLVKELFGFVIRLDSPISVSLYVELENR